MKTEEDDDYTPIVKKRKAQLDDDAPPVKKKKKKKDVKPAMKQQAVGSPTKKGKKGKNEPDIKWKW